MTGLQLLEVGEFGKPHGIKGEISAMIDVDGIEIEADDFVFAEIDGLDVPFRVAGVRYKGAGYLLTLKGINNENEASMLANKPLLMECDPADLEDDDDRIYLEDLKGFELKDSGAPIGTIKDYIEPTEHNPLFVVQTPAGNEIYVPASEELSADIDVENQIIDMDLPAGLVDLNSSKT